MLTLQNHFAAVLSPLLLLGWLLAAPTQAQDLKLGNYDDATKIYTSKDGDFQISFPKAPEETSDERGFADEPVLKNFRFGQGIGVRLITSGNVIAVSYAESPVLKDASVSSLRKLATLFREDLKKSPNDFEIILEEEIKVRGASFGTDFHAIRKSDSTVTRFRVVVAGNKLFAIAALGAASFLDAPEIAGFADTFKLLNVPESDAPQTLAKNSNTLKLGLTKCTFDQTGFSILLPSEPRKEESDLSDPTGRNKIQTQFISETSSGTYMVSHETTRGFILDKPELLDLAFQLVRDAQVERLEGKLLSEKEVQISSTLTGREYRITIPAAAGEYRTQVFFAKEQLFQIIAVGTVDFASSKQTDDVFKSFPLIDEASKSPPETALMEYNSALGGFNARLPSKPIYSRRTEKDGSGVEHIQHRYLCETEDNAVLISVTEFGGLCHNSDAQLNTMCESFVRGMAGKNKVEQFARVQSDVNAHEWTFRHTMPEPGVKVQGRVVIANDRFYIVQAIGDAQYLSNSSTNDIVQSLGVTTEGSKE